MLGVIPESKVRFDPELTKTLTCSKINDIVLCISIATLMMKGSFLWGSIVFINKFRQTGKQAETIKK